MLQLDPGTCQVCPLLLCRPHSLYYLTGKAVSSGQIPASLPEAMEVPRAADGEKGCESCLATSATRWYQWGPAHEHCRLCNFCYTYWRKYGGLKLPTRWGELSLPLPSAAVCVAIETTEKKAGVMTATALLQRKLNKGHLISHVCHVISHDIIQINPQEQLNR